MSHRSPTLAHRAEYALFAGVSTLARWLGDGAADGVGTALGRLAHRLGVRREVVLDNLHRAFPEREEAWVRRTAAASYAHLGREALAMLRLQARSPEEIVRRTRMEGLDALRAALEAGRGAVIVTGHVGNWEVGGAALTARGIALDVVAQRQSNPLFDRALTRTRERMGMRVIHRHRAPRAVLKALRAGRVVAFVADQDARRSGVFVPFFGRLASTHRGPALLALRAGAPLFVATGLRSGDGYHIRLYPVEADRNGPADAVARRLTAAFTARLEAMIRQAPAQYFWHHRRWKTRPRKELAPVPTGIETPGTGGTARFPASSES